MNTSIVYERARSRQRPEMGTKTLVSFLALTFGLSWVPMALFMIFPDQLTALFGEISRATHSSSWLSMLLASLEFSWSGGITG